MDQVLLIIELHDHTQRRITVGRTPLDEWSAWSRDVYLTTHNTHNRYKCITPCGIQTRNPSKRSAADPNFRPRGQRDTEGLYRVIKRSLCTWWLHYRKLQVMFKVSPASLQTFIDKPNCVLEDPVQYSTVHIPNVYCDVHLHLINCVLYWKRQVHRHYLITLYINICHTCTRCLCYLFTFQTPFKAYLLAMYMSLPDFRVLSKKTGSKCILM